MRIEFVYSATPPPGLQSANIECNAMSVDRIVLLLRPGFVLKCCFSNAGGTGAGPLSGTGRGDCGAGVLAHQVSASGRNPPAVPGAKGRKSNARHGPEWSTPTITQGGMRPSVMRAEAAAPTSQLAPE